MSTLNVLSWQNENGLTSYPFSFDIEPRDVIVDAKFIQFDNFVPVLESISVEPDKLIFTITLDYQQVEAVLYKELYTIGEPYRSLRLYNTDKSRYLGVLTVGEGVETLWSNYAGRYMKYSASFLASTVRSIPSKDAVYLLDGSYGDVSLQRTSDDTTIFYNISEKTTLNPAGRNSVTFNAVAGHAVPQNTERPNALKQINLVKPIKNNINLSSNDVIKISPTYGTGLTVALVAGNVSSSFAVPSLNS